MFDSENKNTNTASIDLSRSTPNYFSCRECAAWKDYDVYLPSSPHAFGNRGFAPRCLVMADAGLCRLKLLERALEMGVVRVVVYVQEAQPALVSGSEATWGD